MRKLVLIALLVLGAASLGLARPAPAISIDLAGNGSINVSNWTYGGDYTAHFCDSATISYPDGPNLSVLFVTNYSVSDGAAEYLDADVSGTSLTKSYDPTKGRLTISGVASVADYQQVLRTVYYVDTRTNPTTGNRDIEVQAFYGNTGGNAATCTLSVRRDPNAPKKPGTPTPNYRQATPNPTKDQLSLSLTPAQTVTPPYVDLSGGNGGPNYSTWTYGGSQYWAHICPNAIVSYAGTLTSATITLTNRPDGSSEYLAIQNFSLSGLRTSGYNPGTGQLTVTGSMDSAVCQALLRSIVYVDLKAVPNSSDRKITVKLSAGLASSNLPAVTMRVTVAPGSTPTTDIITINPVPVQNGPTVLTGPSRGTGGAQPAPQRRPPNFLPPAWAEALGVQWSEAYCKQQVLKFSSWADDRQFTFLSSLLDFFLTRKNQPRYDTTYVANQSDLGTLRPAVRKMVCKLIYDAWQAKLRTTGRFKIAVTRQKVYWWPDKILDPTQIAFSAFINQAQGYPLQWYQRNDLLFFTFGGAQISLEGTIIVTSPDTGIDLIFTSDPNDELAINIEDGFSFDDPWWQQLPRQTLFGYLSTYYTACRTLELTYGYSPFNDLASFLYPIRFKLTDYVNQDP